MSSRTASSRVESLAFAPLTITASGSRSPHRRHEAWTRPASIDWIGTGQIPSFHGSQAEAVNADPLQVDPPGLPQLVQQQRLQPLEHPAQAHSCNRRQQVVAEPQPGSVAGNSAQGVEVRAMNTNAATRLRSGTRRGTLPRGRGGGAGSSGWMRCHSSSGSSRSTRPPMAFTAYPCSWCRTDDAIAEGLVGIAGP
jgi:hypothetical protein